MKAASLNHVYKLVWSHVQNAWTVVSEKASTKGKKSLSSKAASRVTSSIFNGTLSQSAKMAIKIGLGMAAFSAGQYVYALPSNAVVDIGHAEFVTSNNNTTLDINQTTSTLKASYNSFNIGANETVNLNQQAGFRAMFIVTGNDASQIQGKFNVSNMLLFVNPNGVYFAHGSEVNVGSVIFSTLKISDGDFLAGNYKFTGTNNMGSIVNHGVIKAKDEGYIVLLGKTVDNSGTLVANNGSVVLGSAQEATLDFFGNGLVKAKLSGNALEATIKNSGKISADGGFVQMATNARSAAINISGIVEANQLVERDGVIRLEGGDHSKVEVSGQLIAKGENTKGGTIEVTGEQVALMNGALLDASGDTGGGTVLVGGDYQGGNASVYNARTTYIATGATIKADAIKQGNGGKVVVWANHATRFYGSISAQGGVLGGNGGFTEVSGKSFLDFAGRVNLSAVNGERGTLLLDPDNITLTNSPASNTSGFQPGVDNQQAYTDNSGQDSVFNVGAGGSFTGVGNNANIVLQANNNINVNSNFNLATATGNTDVSVTLMAKNDINLNANIIADGAGSVTLTADSDNNNVGNLNLNGSITTDKGIVSLEGVNITHTSGDITTNGSTVLIQADASADLGSLKINTYDQSTNAARSTGGNVLILGGKGITMNGEINTADPSATGVTYAGGQGGNVVISAPNNVDLQDTKINVASESVTTPINGSTTAISGNITIIADNVNMSNGSLNTNGMGETGAGVTTNITGNVFVTAGQNANLGTTKIDTAGSTPANSDGINGGSVILVGKNVTVGDVNANGSSATSSNGNGGAGGQIAILANTDLSVGNITANGGNSTGTGNAGNAATVNLAVNNGNITMQSVDATGGNAAGTGTSGNGGNVNVFGNALIASDATINTTGVTGGNVTFAGTVDSAASGNSALIVNTNGTTTFSQSVGSNKALASLTTDAGGTTELFGSTVKTTGNQTYNDRVNLHTGVTFETTAGGNVTVSDVLNAAGNAVIVNTGSGNFTAMNALNQLTTVQVNSGLNVSVRDVDDLTLESANLSGDLLVRAGNDLTLNGNVVTTSATATAVQLVAERNFNNAANGTISTGAGGRWLVYSTNPTNVGENPNGLTATYNFKQYNTSFGGTILGSGNGFVYKVAPTLNVNLSGTSTKTFDGNNTVTDLSGLTANLSGFFNNDQAGAVSPITGAVFDNAAVGVNKPITASYNPNTTGAILSADGKFVYGYQFVSTSTATGSITAAPTTGFASPRDDAGLGGLIANNPVLNTMFIVSLNPAAGDEEDLDAVACPTPEDHLGSTPILSSGVKLPDGVNSNCI